MGGLFALLTGIVLLLVLFASRAKNARRKELAYIGAFAIAIFAIGYGALIGYGLSGCGGGTEAGLTWDWPW